MSERAYYFGCWQRPGHYFWTPGPTSVREHYGVTVARLPWDRVDGGLNPSSIQSEAALHHAGDWTALAMTDRTVDDRGGSNSVFFLHDSLTFEQALSEARRLFPVVVARIEAARPIFDTTAPAPSSTRPDPSTEPEGMNGRKAT